MERLSTLMLVYCLLPLVPAFSRDPGDTPKKHLILMIIADRNFRDEELFVPRKLFDEKGMSVTVASTVTSAVDGMLKGQAKPDILLKDAKAGDYDAVIFVGGSGAAMYFDDDTAHQTAKDAAKESKVLLAFCIGPIILANAGLMK